MLKFALSVFLVATGLWFAGSLVMQSLQEEVSLNFTVDAEFEVDGVTYRGAAVWEMKNWIVKFPATAGPYSEVRAEAIALTGGPRNLYLLRKRIGGTSGDAYGGFPEYCVPNELPINWNSLDWLRTQFSEPCEVSLQPRVRLPTLIEIPDLDQPSSIREMDYAVAPSEEPCHSPCLRSLMVEKTRSPVTTGIEQRLPWLKNFEFGMTDVETGAIARSSGPGMVHMLIDFSTELGTGRMYGL